ncbi:MAG: Methyltransferase-like protein 5, partial [Marteilia pararefringens]
MLTIASLMYNCAHCFSVEIDYDALQLQKDNISEILDKRLYLTRLSLIQSDALDLSFKHQIDTVITNPPFGTKWTANIDTKILKKAFEIATVVYSIHKTSTSESCNERIIVTRYSVIFKKSHEEFFVRYSESINVWNKCFT